MIGATAWRRPITRFAGDERAAGTEWGLTIFILLTAFCGLAIDSTDAFRGQTMLQASADAAALAAAIDLPDRGAATATALAYAARNMARAEHGEVLRPADIVFGRWDAARRQLDTGAAEADTVMVTLRRADANGNPWRTNFLRILGLFDWDVTARAAAQRFIPRCIMDGLVAGGMVNLSSNNGFTGGMCMHGNAGVDMQNHNSFAADTRVSMPRVPEDLQVPAGDLDGNPGLEAALVEDILRPRMVNDVEAIMDGVVALDPAVTPDYIDVTQPVIRENERYGFEDLEAGRVYYLQCAPNKSASIPADTRLERVAIVSECRIHLGADVTLSDVLLASRGARGGGGDSANISFAARPVIGAPDDCAPGGGVQVFSTGSVHFSSSAAYHGVQIVAAGDIDLGARNGGINGVIAQAGGDITMTSNNAFGQCTGGAPQLFTSWHYRLVF